MQASWPLGSSATQRKWPEMSVKEQSEPRGASSSRGLDFHRPGFLHDRRGVGPCRSLLV